MSLLVSFSASAAAQVRSAASWWDTRAPGLLEQELTTALGLLSEHPYAGESYAQNQKIKGLRRRLLPKTAYYLYYLHHESRGFLEVVALWSTRPGTPPPL